MKKLCLKLNTRDGRIRILKYLVSFTLLGVACVNGARSVSLSKLMVSDYAAYWTASRLLISGDNPYDAVKVFAIQSAMRKPPSGPLVMRNPPWAFALVLPFGVASYKLSRTLWTIPEVFIVIGCAFWTWKRYSRSPSTRWVAALITATLFPALWVLVMGQITPFILLGVTGFLYCESTDRSNSWLQAACLALIALKPHLLYLFWVALVLSACWALRSLDRTTRDLRRWLLFCKCGALLLAFSAIPVIFDHGVFSQYLDYLRKTPILMEAIPTPGNLLYIKTHLRFAQFAPMLAGCVWLLWHWRRNRETWNWAKQMPLLLMVSLATTTYGWFYDQVLILPAILYAAAQNFPARNKKHAVVVVVSYLAVNLGIAALFYSCQRLSDFRMLWTMPAWCSLYAALLWLARERKNATITELRGDNAEAGEPVGYAANLVG